MIRLLWIVVALVLPAASLTPCFAIGQNSQSAVDLSLDKLRLKRSQVEVSQNLNQESKDRAIKLIDQAIDFRKLFDEFRRQSEALSRQIKTAPQRVETVQAELARPFQPPEAVAAKAAKKNTLALEQRLQKEQAQLTAAKDLLLGWNDQLKKQKDLFANLPINIANAKKLLEAVNEELQGQVAAGDPALIIESRRLLLRAEQLKLEAQIRMYELQLNSHEILASLLRAERDLAARDVTSREALVKAWQAELAKRLQQEVIQGQEAAEEAKDKIPEFAAEVKKQYDINIKLGAQLEEVSRQETGLTQNLERTEKQLQQLKEEVSLAKERVKTLVLTEAIGLALRQQRQLLPSSDKYRQNSGGRKIEMSKIREIQYKLERQRRKLTDVESETDKIIDSLVYLTPKKAEVLRLKVRKLLTDRRRLLEKLQTAYNRYFKDLQNLEFAEQQLVGKAEAYADFLDAHLVWIRSSSVINLSDLKNSLAVLRVMVDPAGWRLTISDTLVSFKAHPGTWVLGLLISAVLLFGRTWARREISRMAAKVNKWQKDRFSLTLWSLALTIYLAAGFPFLMFFMARQLSQIPGAYDFIHAIATGLKSAAGSLAGFGFFYHLCRRNGLAQVHFKWSEPARQSLLRNLRWVTPVVVLMGFLVSAMATFKKIEFGDSMAKLALMVQVVVFSAFLSQLLRFSGGIVSNLLKNYPTGWLTRLRYVWWPVAVGMPIFLAVLAASGYFLSALQLRDLFRTTMLLVMILIILNSLALRWLSLARRRLAIREARRKRDEQREAKRRQHEEIKISATDEKSTPIKQPEPEIGLAEIDEQTRSMLRTVMFILVAIGLWAIWEPVFPAFDILQDIHLWSYNSVVNGVTTAIPISLANLAMAVVVVVITVIASSNLPGLLEITLINRLPMDAGARYAFTTLCRYAITAIGFILAFNTIGFRWSSIQWLIAALGVGLGFGLQEIVANFVCGLIVLFERPFRVGDTVTIGDISGTVSRIRIRATTILDWDRKELIVPNKEFITGRLINWSLSDPISRFKISVGIAYGSDTELAEKLLLKVLKENPLVLKDPKPHAYFLGFGDNSLNFELRLYIDNIDNRLPVLHELHKAIDSEFRKAGIVIAFPQHDVHFDNDRPLKIQVMPEKPKPDTAQ